MDDYNRPLGRETLITKRAQAIHLTCAILSAVAKYNTDDVRLSEIGRKVEINVSTVHRFLNAGFPSFWGRGRFFRLAAQIRKDQPFIATTSSFVNL